MVRDMNHVFDEATTVEKIDSADRYTVRATTHPAYNNMVGPFGGITAATVVRAIVDHPTVLGDPLALTINYAAPIAEGEWDLTLEAIRTNRTNQHWTFTIGQNEQTVATGTAVFGVRRDTWGDTEGDAPQLPPVDEVPAVDRKSVV